MGRCSHDTCKKQPSFNVEGSKKAVYCKTHAKKGMVRANGRRCCYPSCNKQPNYNIKGSSKAAYCKQHAEASMVGVHRKSCFYYSCASIASFNVEGSKSALFCKKHAEDDMVDVVSKRCSGNSCTKRPSFNVRGNRNAVYCKQHAEDGMVNVTTRRCAHDSCRKTPTFNADGSTRACYCKQHAARGMLHANKNKRCSQVSCTGAPRWGLWTDGAATVCARHKSELLGGHIVNFKALCEVAGCFKQRRCGLDGKQSTYCPSHDSFKEGPVCTTGMTPSQAEDGSPSNGAIKDPSFHVKPECFF